MKFCILKVLTQKEKVRYRKKKNHFFINVNDSSNSALFSHFDISWHFLAAAEGAHLGTYYYDQLKSEKKPAPEFTCFTAFTDNPER